VVYAKVYKQVDAEGVVAFDKLPPPPLEAPPIVKDNILALLEARMDPTRAAPIQEAAMNIFNFYKSEEFGKVRPGSGGSWGAPEGFFTQNLVGRRWRQLARRDADFVKWSDEILPASKTDTKEEREKKEREFNEIIRAKATAGRNRDACRMLDNLAMNLWRTHWDCDYMRYIEGDYIPAKVSATLGSAGGENLYGITVYNNLSKDPKSWIKSEDIGVPYPSARVSRPRTNGEGVETVALNVWSVEGILSGEYDKLTPHEKQWYLHTYGPIKQ